MYAYAFYRGAVGEKGRESLDVRCFDGHYEGCKTI
jgi:hypothetical protein